MSDPAERIAVCAVLHESVDHLAPLLRSLAAQTRVPEDWIFCVNGRDDGATARLRELLDEVVVLPHPENPGFSGGANACLAATRADFALLLNPDVELAPDFLERALEAMRAEPRAAAVGGLLWREDRAGRPIVDSAGFRLQPWMRLVDRLSGRPLEEVESRRVAVPGACGAALLLRRAALADLAGPATPLDESFWMYKEDQDLGLRLRAAGWSVVFEPRARARHRRGWRPGARGGVPLELRASSLANRWMLLVKHFRWGRDAWRIPFVLAFEGILTPVLLLSEPKMLKRAWALARRRWPAARRARRELLERERAVSG